jgi:hypothetical protein
LAGKAPADLSLQVIQRHVFRFELAVELFLGEGRLDLGDLGVHFFVGGDQVELGSTLLLDVIVDQIAQDFEVSDLRLHLGGLLRAVAEVAVVIPFERSPVNGMAVDGGNDVRLVGTVAASDDNQGQKAEGEPEGGTVK